MEARKIIITGGATRIGAAIAKKLSGTNKEILIHFNKSKLKAEKLKKELELNGTKVYLVKGDLSKENDESGCARIRNSGGPILQRRLSGRGSLIGFDYKNKDNPFFSPPH